MFSFLLSRLAQAVIVMGVVSLIAFSLFQFVGDPVSQMLGQDATVADRERLRTELGLDRSFLTQFAAFVGNAVQGNLGFSLKQGRPVYDLLLERLPATLELSFIASIIAVGLGIPLGVYTAIYRNRTSSRLIMAFSLLGVSLPTFFIGIILILVFSVMLGWLPSFGRGQTVFIGWWASGLLTFDGWRHMVLPATTLALFQLALVVRLVRSEMLEVLRADFIRFARARGVRKRSVHFRHALRNALLPVMTIIGLQLGTIVAFALITETVFQWPGMGLLFAQSVAFADVPVMAVYLCLIALVFVTINFVVDALYAVVDPRFQTEKG